MSDDDVNGFRLTHIEEKGRQHDSNFEKINEKMTDVEKYNIRQEGSQTAMTTSIAALTTSLTAVTEIVNEINDRPDLAVSVSALTADVKEIKDRPLRTYRKLTWAIIAGTITLAFAAITNGIMFYISAVAKGLIK